MIPARVQAFMEVYVVELAKLAGAHPEAYCVQSGETAEDKALRVAVHTAGLIERHGAAVLMEEAPGIARTCAVLGISNTTEAMDAYFNGE